MFDLDFPRAWPLTSGEAVFRQCPADFVVQEQLGFALTGAGEHGCLYLEKTGQNTLWVAKQLAGRFGVPIHEVGYCGLKDRQAVTRQWFSVRMPGVANALPEDPQIEGVAFLDAARHARKLRRGDHAGNAFVIRLRAVQGRKSVLAARFQQVCSQGVPNYFGEQRFGIGGSNLAAAQALATAHPRVWRERRNQFALSAVRAWIFNAVLAERVRSGQWQVCMPGERGATPSGPLWGRGRLASSGDLRALEERIAGNWPEWTEVLEHAGLSQESRPLCLLPTQASCCWEGEDWVLSFFLPPGAYATSVLRELLQLSRPGPDGLS